MREREIASRSLTTRPSSPATGESASPKVGKVAEGGRDEVRRLLFLAFKGVEGALAMSKLRWAVPALETGVLGALSRARAEISLEREAVGRLGMEQGIATTHTRLDPV